MIRMVRTEMVKFFSTRMWWGMAIAVSVIGIGLTGLIGFAMLSGSHGEAMPKGMELGFVRMFYTMGWKMGSLLMLVLGVMFVGQEFRHKTITSTFLSFPKRAQLMGAKVIAMMLIGMGYGLVYLVGSVLAGSIALSVKGLNPFPQPAELLKTFALLLVVLGFWALIGLGVGILIPNQIAAILVSVAVAWIVEPIIGLLIMFARDVKWLSVLGKALPTNASQAMLELGGGDAQMQQAMGPWWLGLIVLACWAGVSALIGALLTVRKDIS